MPWLLEAPYRPKRIHHFSIDETKKIYGKDVLRDKKFKKHNVSNN